MQIMKEDGSSAKWILAIIGATLTGCLYLICCICSIHKALKDRKNIIERNCTRRNNKYLKEMGIDSDKENRQNERNHFAISRKENPESQITIEEKKPDPEPVKVISPVYPPTNAKKINLENIEEILNESLSANVSASSSLVGKTISEHSHSENNLDPEELKYDKPIVTSLRKPKIIESVPKVYYLKAHNSFSQDKNTQPNWITERLSNASSIAEAQRQLQYGYRKAPLAKQNSGFSSMDEDSSASYNC